MSSFPPLNTLLHTNPKSPALDACREGAVENQRASLLKTPFPGAEASLGPESYFLVPTITQNYQNYLNSRAGTPLQKSSSETPRRTGRAGKEGWRDGLRGPLPSWSLWPRTSAHPIKHPNSQASHKPQGKELREQKAKWEPLVPEAFSFRTRSTTDQEFAERIGAFLPARGDENVFRFTCVCGPQNKHPNGGMAKFSQIRTGMIRSSASTPPSAVPRFPR